MSDALFALPASFATYVLLTQFLTRHKIKKEMFEVVDEAVNAWMNSLEAEKDANEASTLNGYQWKHLFLPEGTKLRTICEGAHLIAHVQGCRLMYEGRICSPSQFVNGVHESCRNAWKTIWVLLPAETEWKLANEFRCAHSPIRERKSTNKNKKARFRTVKTNRQNEIGPPAPLQKIAEQYDYLRCDESCSPIDPLSFVDRNGDTLLHIAAQLNDLVTMEALLQAGLSANCTGDMGTTPLHCAWSHEASKLLLSFGASNAIRDEFGRLPGQESYGEAKAWSSRT